MENIVRKRNVEVRVTHVSQEKKSVLVQVEERVAGNPFVNQLASGMIKMADAGSIKKDTVYKGTLEDISVETRKVDDVNVAKAIGKDTMDWISLHGFQVTEVIEPKPAK